MKSRRVWAKALALGQQGSQTWKPRLGHSKMVGKRDGQW